MFGLRPLARQSPARQTWTCLKCSFERPRIPIARPRRPRYASTSAEHIAQPRKPKKRRTGLILTAAAALAGYGAIKYTDGGRYVQGAIARTTRVVTVLTANINDYRQTLKQRDSQTREDYDSSLKDCHKRCAERTLQAMEANGSVFIKLGQHLTSLNYLLPSEWCDTFIPLQDHCPVTPIDRIKAMVEGDTGQPFTSLFTTFSEQPLGAASLAQVHLATDAASGQQVAVKVQHPALDDWAPLDLTLTKFTFNTLKRVFPEYDLTWLSDEMQISLPQELDFALEGANAEKAKDYFAPVRDCPLVVPSVFWAKRRILVMEYITGHRLDDLAYLSEHNIDRDEVSAALARIFNTMIFAPGAPLHCDPHGGNIAIRSHPKSLYPDSSSTAAQRSHAYNFDIVLYDHGLYRTIPLPLQRSYAKLWLSVLEADEAGMRCHAHAVAGITDEQFPLFASAITGRDYRVVTQNVSSIPRSDAEREAMSDALGDGLLQQLVELLGKVPRIILLILKTNDLTRSLDAKLQTRKGPVRSFLILARYAARTVLDEQIERLRELGGLLWPLGNLKSAFGAYARYGVVVGKLTMYEWWLFARALVGLENEAPGGVIEDALKAG